MALQQNVDLPSDINLATAYLKIRCVRLVYVDAVTTVEVIIDVYKDLAARTAGKEPVTTFLHKCIAPDVVTYFGDSMLNAIDKNPRSVGYAWLKSLTDYSGASDV
jgi:hypothetical protein